MRVLLLSAAFPPAIGGLETAGYNLARGLSGRGHEVIVVTDTPQPVPTRDPAVMTVLVRPAWADLLRVARGADIVVHNNIQARRLWVQLAARKPHLYIMHTWAKDPEGIMRQGAAAVKRLLLTLGPTVCVSRALQASLPPRANAVVIRNAYDRKLFQPQPKQSDRDGIVFVGRLVSDKGCIDAIRALTSSVASNVRLSVVGQGPDLPLLQAAAVSGGVAARVHFLGPLQGQELADVLRLAKGVVVPSRWQEPFGLVALEGLACGARPVVADVGGLLEAAGPNALTFPAGNIESLASLLSIVCYEPAMRFTREIEQHLQRHHVEFIAEAYDSLMQKIASTPRSNLRGAKPGN